MNDYLSTRELYHHGIKGQKWGVRRFQNEDGSLTDAGKKLRNASIIGTVTGATAGLGISTGLVRNSLKKKTWTPSENNNARGLVDAYSGKTLKQFVRGGIFKVVGSTFVGGFLGRAIARGATKSAIERADKAAAKVEKQVEKTASKINDEVAKYE